MIAYCFADWSLLSLLAHHQVYNVLYFLPNVLIKFDIRIADSVVQFFVGGAFES